jgi:hypothetical protein
MINLLRQDLLFNRNIIIMWVAILTGYGIFFALTKLPPGLALAITIVMASMMPFTFFAREDKFKGAPLRLSLPVNRRAVNRARFLGAWLTTAAGTLYGMTLFVLFGWGTVPLSQVLSIKILFTGLCTVTIIVGFLMPLVIRFGIMGLMGVMVGLQVLGVIFFILASQFRMAFDLKAIAKSVESAILFVNAQLGTAGFYLVLLALVVLINVGTCRLSGIIYARKEF